jgi:hypothetical protein
MTPPRARRVRHGLATVIVAFVGAVVGAVAGLVSSVVAFVAWGSVAGGEGSDDVAISALLLFTLFIVPVATLSGIAVAVTLHRRRTS